MPFSKNVSLRHPFLVRPADLKSMRGSRGSLLSSTFSRIVFKVSLTPAFFLIKLIWSKLQCNVVQTGGCDRPAEGRHVVMKRTLLLLLLGVAVFALALGCSSGNGGTDPDDPQDPAEETIGPAGGTIELDGEARLVIPAGALAGAVDFSLGENGSPTTPPANRLFVTGAYSVEPSGTAFTTPATITLEYDEGDLAGEDESSIVIYTDDGRAWRPLTTTVNESDNEVSAEIDHLSDFVATVNGGSSADGVFAALRVHRGVMKMPGIDPIITDFLVAWFDSTVAPCAPASPIMVDSVTCNEYALEWSAAGTLYKYTPPVSLPFLVEDATYTFDVDGGGQAPDLTASIDFLDSSPYITEPEMGDTVSLGGFTVTWSVAGSENIFLTIVGVGGAGFVGVETANTGSHTFSASELSELSAAPYALTLNYVNEENIDETGYDPDSYIRAQVTSPISMTLE